MIMLNTLEKTKFKSIEAVKSFLAKHKSRYSSLTESDDAVIVFGYDNGENKVDLIYTEVKQK